MSHCPHTFHGNCPECSSKTISVNAYEKIDKEICELWETVENTRDRDTTFASARDKFDYVRKMLHSMVRY